MNLYIVSYYPPCITAFLVAFCDNKYPNNSNIVNHIRLDIINGIALLIVILPEYILNGRSSIYLNGRIYAIFFSNGGKNASGIVPPENISPDTINKFIIPFSSIVNIVIMCISNDMDVTNRLDINRDIKNNINDAIDIGGYNLYGYGSNSATISTGKNLNSTADILAPYMVAYHFL